MAESGRIQTLDQELKKLKEVVDRLHPLLNFERLSYNILESQHQQLRDRNEKLRAENSDIEANIAKSVETAKQVVAQGEEERKRLRVAAGELYAKAYEKFKEFEESLSKADKKTVEKHLRELQEVGSG